MKILIYIRPNSQEFLVNLAKAIDPECEILQICDFRGFGDVWCGQFLNDSDRKRVFNDDIYENIRLRCRFLRTIDRETAITLIEKYTFGVCNIFDSFQPDIVLGQLPDNYCMDVIQRIALIHNSTIINMVGEFIRGYCRMTLRGERIYTREATREEAEKVVAGLLDKDYKSNYSRSLGDTYKEHMRHFWRRKLVELFYYPLIKLKENDRWNYHYNSLYYKGKQLHDVVIRDADIYFSHITDIQIPEKSIYVPLHCYPEATVDYYGDNPEYALYEELMLRICKETDPSITLLIKEHPAMYGARPIDFYKKLKGFKNVILINPYDNSNLVLTKCNYVLTYSGSVGIEAIIREKVVLAITENYYSDLSPNIHRVYKLDKDIFNYTYIPYDNVEFIRKLLCGLMDVKMGGQSNLIETDIPGMAKYMRQYYERKPLQVLN